MESGPLVDHRFQSRPVELRDVDELCEFLTRMTRFGQGALGDLWGSADATPPTFVANAAKLDRAMPAAVSPTFTRRAARPGRPTASKPCKTRQARVRLVPAPFVAGTIHDTTVVPCLSLPPWGAHLATPTSDAISTMLMGGPLHRRAGANAHGQFVNPLVVGWRLPVDALEVIRGELCSRRATEADEGMSRSQLRRGHEQARRTMLTAHRLWLHADEEEERIGIAGDMQKQLLEVVAGAGWAVRCATLSVEEASRRRGIDSSEGASLLLALPWLEEAQRSHLSKAFELS